MALGIVANLFDKLGIKIYRKSYLPKGVDWIHDAYRLSKENRWEINTIFDIGANIGEISIELANVFDSSKIYAFEPIHSTYDHLCNNTKTLKSRITPINYGLSSEPSEAEFLICNSWPGKNKINRLKKSGEQPDELYDSSEVCNLTTIDNFFEHHNLQKVDILKTDTEGFDLEVLQGGSMLLSTNPPKIIVSEVDFDNLGHTDFYSLQDYLVPFGYSLYALYNYWHNPSNRILYCNAMFVLMV